jgi:hypothetical protein
LEKKESNFGKKKQEKRGNLEKKMKKNKKIEKKKRNALWITIQCLGVGEQ